MIILKNKEKFIKTYVFFLFRIIMFNISLAANCPKFRISMQLTLFSVKINKIVKFKSIIFVNLTVK